MVWGAHPYPEEVFIVSGRLYDHAFGSGWRQVITEAVIPVRDMVHSKLMEDTWSLKSHFRIVYWTPTVPHGTVRNAANTAVHFYINVSRHQEHS